MIQNILKMLLLLIFINWLGGYATLSLYKDYLYKAFSKYNLNGISLVGQWWPTLGCLLG